MSGKARQALSLQQQADLIDALLLHCTMKGGEIAAETHLTISAPEAGDLTLLALRLRRMVPHEAAIKRMVMGN